MLYSAGIDALTFTLRSGSDESKWVAEMYDKYIQQDVASGNDLKNSGHSRYEGVRSKHMFMGTDGKHDLYETKSGYADEVANELKAQGVKVHATRMDWAVTYPMRGDRETYCDELRRVVREAVKLPKQRIPGHSVLHENINDGNTLYIQSSDKQLVHRTYNKDVQDPGMYPKDAYRHEIQQRAPRSERAWEKFLDSPSSQWLARSYVMGFLLQYGIQEEWMADTEPCPPPSKATRSDTERRLQWLENSVMPVYEKLLGAGVRQAALVTMLRKTGLNVIEG
jgi:hypothetical protein